MKRKLTNGELSAFASQLSMVLHAGLSVTEGIMIMSEDTPEGEEKKRLEQIRESLDQYMDFSEAMEKEEVFPSYFVEMTKLGERSGTLEDVMRSLGDYYGNQDSLFRSIKDALTYPLVLMTMLFAVLMVLVWQVMPVFETVFEQLGVNLTGLSKTIFAVSDVLHYAGVFLAAALIITMIWVLWNLKSENGRMRLKHLISKVAIGRGISQQMACGKFTGALSLALHSGLDPEEGFMIAAGLIDDTDFKAKLESAAVMIREGKELPQAIRDAGMISGMSARMLTIGYRSGNMEEALEQIGNECYEEANIRIQNAVGALEPVLTAVLSVLTGLILISVMLPLLSVMANLGI